MTGEVRLSREGLGLDPGRAHLRRPGAAAAARLAVRHLRSCKANQLNYHGFLRAPMRVGIGSGDNVEPGVATGAKLHSPAASSPTARYTNWTLHRRQRRPLDRAAAVLGQRQGVRQRLHRQLQPERRRLQGSGGPAGHQPGLGDHQHAGLLRRPGRLPGRTSAASPAATAPPAATTPAPTAPTCSAAPTPPARRSRRSTTSPTRSPCRSSTASAPAWTSRRSMPAAPSAPWLPYARPGPAVPHPAPPRPRRRHLPGPLPGGAALPDRLDPGRHPGRRARRAHHLVRRRVQDDRHPVRPRLPGHRPAAGQGGAAGGAACSRPCTPGRAGACAENYFGAASQGNGNITTVVVGVDVQPGHLPALPGVVLGPGPGPGGPHLRHVQQRRRRRRPDVLGGHRPS